MRALHLTLSRSPAPLRRLTLALCSVTLLAACGDSGATDTSGSTEADGSSTLGSTGDVEDTLTEPTTDPGSSSSGDEPTSTTQSTQPTCGDGELDPGEQCDDGEANGEGAASSDECTQQVRCDEPGPIALLSRTPSGQGGVLAADAGISLEFACSVDRATVDDSTIVVHGSHSGRRSFTVEWTADSQASLVLAAPLLPGERIDVTLTAGIHGLDGGALTPQVFHFTVAGAPASGDFTELAPFIGDSYPALGDLDGDGDLDIARANGRVYFNEGSNAFTEVEVGFTCEQGFVGHVVLADIDGDRDLDLVCRGPGLGEGSWWRNDGAGGFTEAPAMAALEGHNMLVPGDLDADGDLDLYAVTSSFELADSILLNDGGGAFTLGADDVGFPQTEGVTLADADGDGDLDAVIGSGDLDVGATYWKNDGAAGFSESGAWFGPGAHASHGIDAGDLDGDDDLDVLALPLLNPGSTWQNDGAPRFSEAEDLSTKYIIDAILRDVDGDLDLDILIVSNYLLNPIGQVWLGAGDGSFESGPSFGAGAEHGLALGDLNGDGKLDAVVDKALFLGK